MRTILLGLLIAICNGAWAQNAAGGFPGRPIRIVIGYAAGGPTDIVGRLYASKLSEYYGVPVIVDNRAGAAGIIGTELVAKAPPDGYTLALGVISTHALHSAHGRKLPYDPVRDFAPISQMVRGPLAMVVPPALKASTLKEFIALAQANPGKLNYGAAGVGSPTHLAAELFKIGRAHV